MKQEILDLPHKSLIEMKKCGSQNLFCGLKIFFCALHLEQMQAAKFILQAAFFHMRAKVPNLPDKSQVFARFQGIFF